MKELQVTIPAHPGIDPNASILFNRQTIINCGIQVVATSDPNTITKIEMRLQTRRDVYIHCPICKTPVLIPANNIIHTKI